MAEFPDQQFFLGFLKPLSPYLNLLPDEDKKEEFMDELLIHDLEYVPQREMGVVYDFSCVYTNSCEKILLKIERIIVTL